LTLIKITDLIILLYFQINILFYILFFLNLFLNNNFLLNKLYIPLINLYL